jgi:hypothetical protein
MGHVIHKREAGASDSIRLPTTLLDRARIAGEVESRSIPKQVEYWARIGQLVVESPAVRSSTLRDLIKSGLSFDEFTEAQKFVALANAGAYFDALDGDAELAAELASQGVPLASGAGGRVTWSNPGESVVTVGALSRGVAKKAGKKKSDVRPAARAAAKKRPAKRR